VFTAHTWCFAEGTSWKWRIAGIPAERVAAWFSAAIINVSNANRDLALRHGVADQRRLVTIWNGIPDTRFRAWPGSVGTPLVVMVARCVPQKDHGLLLRVLARIQRPVRAVFVGDGPLLPALRAQAAQLRLQQRVEFVGNRSDVAQILSRAAVFALPTHWEGFPLSILEAMRAGLPVIASNVGGISEAIVENETGFLAERGDEEMFLDRLALLLEDAGLRARMGAAARARYEAEFTLKRMLDKTTAVYRTACLTPHSGHVSPAIARAARTGRAGSIS
jgi:glycosyltransferase involved in cell wall biosynthesis